MGRLNQCHLIFDAKVHHRRLGKKKNHFSYRTYYACLLLDKIMILKDNFLFGVNQLRLYSYYDKDHGNRCGKPAIDWAKKNFNDNGVYPEKIYLITMPRVLGYLFNPISFWLGFNQGKLVGVINEVNNTFGQTHSYLCVNQDSKPILKNDWFTAEKALYVSPFYPREGHYQFNFDINLNPNKKAKIVIHYFLDNKRQLVTSVEGTFKQLNYSNLIMQFIKTPFLTFKVIYLIHYQALKLVLKGIKTRKRPKQEINQLTICNNINKI
ncbi:DUF1365 domain-containing protein [Thiotrichales bacterium 19S3-7]|nr:DUF1365 domain-containing protein [Thiotrichales bacterium 19S3-7]MCF6800641.1 DUF1365 domain-containing protein [Thiotrichales bacterium 19S3-11]